MLPASVPMSAVTPTDAGQLVDGGRQSLAIGDDDACAGQVESPGEGRSDSSRRHR